MLCVGHSVMQALVDSSKTVAMVEELESLQDMSRYHRRMSSAANRMFGAATELRTKQQAMMAHNAKLLAEAVEQVGSSLSCSV